VTDPKIYFGKLRTPKDTWLQSLTKVGSNYFYSTTGRTLLLTSSTPLAAKWRTWTLEQKESFAPEDIFDSEFEMNTITKGLLAFNILLSVLYNSYTIVDAACEDLKTNCLTCIQTAGCSFCASDQVSGCVSDARGASCGLIGGVLNNCNVTGTRCSYYNDCGSCLGDSGCSYCLQPNGGICMNAEASFVCSSLGGTLTSAGCGETVTATQTQPQQPPSTLDTTATCEQFAGNQCIGTVFYNVYVNSSYSQQDMNTDIAKLMALAYFPGVTDACRNAAILLSCGDTFSECENIVVNGKTIGVRIPTCRSLCETVTRECGPVLSMVGKTLDCSTYPQDTFSLSYGGQNNDFKCNNMVPDSISEGYYPNLLLNYGLDVLDENLQLEHWTSLYPYQITNDTQWGYNPVVANLNGTSFGLFQYIPMNRTSVLPLRITGVSKAISVVGAVDIGYSISAQILYDSGNNITVFAPFLNGTHDFQLASVEFIPPSPVQSITVFINFL